MKKIIFLGILGGLWVLGALGGIRKVWAAENNKFGIHILETSDVDKARQLVNSTGGDWGYVTVVMREDDLNKDKWQKFMDDCRRFHLIPIVRIATHMDTSGSWAKPGMDDLRKWHEFLNGLNWPVTQQIVTIFNEPNQAKEWGGEVNPREYALVLEKLTNLLKEANPNFVVLNAGLDQAADGRNGTMTEAYFLSEMRAAVPDIFNKLDGWASHSYPNHGFVGLPDNTGLASVRGYEWELNDIKNLGGTKELPVFITETGWPHAEGMINQGGFYESTKIAQYTEKAFSIWEKDDRVKAVTPFVLDYPVEPFDHFSWLKLDGSEYEQFSQISSLPKVSGLPEQRETYAVNKMNLPDLLPTNYTVKAKLTIRNTGQWIMGERHEVQIVLDSTPTIKFSDININKDEQLFPGDEKTFDLMVQTGTQSAEEHLSSVGGRDYTIYIYKPFDLTNKKVNLWQQMMNKIKLWLMEMSEK